MNVTKDSMGNVKKSWGLFNSKNVLVDLKLSISKPVSSDFEFGKKWLMSKTEASTYSVLEVSVKPLISLG